MKEYLELIEAKKQADAKMKLRCMEEVSNTKIINPQEVISLVDEAKRMIVRYFPEVENTRLNGLFERYFNDATLSNRQELIREFDKMVDETISSFDVRKKNRDIEQRHVNQNVCNLNGRDLANYILKSIEKTYGLVSSAESERRFDRLSDQLDELLVDGVREINFNSSRKVVELDISINDAIRKYVDKYKERLDDAFKVTEKDVSIDGSKFEIASSKEKYVVTFDKENGTKKIDGFRNGTLVPVREADLMEFLSYVAPDMEDLIQTKRAEIKDVTLIPFGMDTKPKEIVDMNSLDDMHKESIDKYGFNKPELKPFGEDISKDNEIASFDELGTSVKPFTEEMKRENEKVSYADMFKTTSVADMPFGLSKEEEARFIEEHKEENSNELGEAYEEARKLFL